jgi:hypothetical protein
MKIFRSKKNNQLYTLSESRHAHSYGELTAEPYNRFGNDADKDLIYKKGGKKKKTIKMEDFEEVGLTPMKTKEIIEYVGKGKKVKFSYYRDNKLWYETECGLIFPVPVSDTGNGTFLAEDKAIMFMRWIRKYVKEIQEEGS